MRILFLAAALFGLSACTTSRQAVRRAIAAADWRSVVTVAGIVMISVGTEKSVADSGFIPLRNMWCPQTM